MDMIVNIVGAGLAGSEAALQLRRKGVQVRLFEMRAFRTTDVHAGSLPAELVCSNSLKSMKPDSAAGMLKTELASLGSALLDAALSVRVAAGGALAVDREAFSAEVSRRLDSAGVARIDALVTEIHEDGSLGYVNAEGRQTHSQPADAVILATGPLTEDALASWLAAETGEDHLAFFDAAAPIVMADSLNDEILFRQSRYEADSIGDYLNAPMNREEYESFVDALLAADKVIARDFETADLFRACQPVEEIARTGRDSLRHGTMKPVGLTDPATGKRPWAAVQLRAEDAHGESYNLVGFQTNLTFPEQRRVFRMIPGLEQAEFARYGVMHRNTFIDAPHLLNTDLSLRKAGTTVPLYIAGQLGGTEGYSEAIMSGLYAALSLMGERGILHNAGMLPQTTAFGSLLSYATSPETADYQPSHVNFGIFTPLDTPIKNKRERYRAYADRGREAIIAYAEEIGAFETHGAVLLKRLDAVRNEVLTKDARR